MKHLHILFFACLVILSSCKQNAKDTNNTDANVQDSAVQTQSNENNGTSPDLHPPDQQPLTPAPNEEPKINLANIEQVEIMSGPKPNNVTVMIHGIFPNPCTHLAETMQTNHGNKIEITVKTVVPPGVSCPQTPVPLHHSVPLKTQGLKPGKYEVSVNGKIVIYEKK